MKMRQIIVSMVLLGVFLGMPMRAMDIGYSDDSDTISWLDKIKFHVSDWFNRDQEESFEGDRSDDDIWNYGAIESFLPVAKEITSYVAANPLQAFGYTAAGATGLYLTAPSAIGWTLGTLGLVQNLANWAFTPIAVGVAVHKMFPGIATQLSKINRGNVEAKLVKAAASVGTLPIKVVQQAASDVLTNPTIIAGMQQNVTQATQFAGQGVVAASQGFSANIAPHMKDMVREAAGIVLNTRNVAQFGGLTALMIGLPVTGYYGTKVFWNVLQHRLITPAPVILLPGTKYGRYDRLKRYLSGYKTPPMIFDESVKFRLEEIEEQTKNIRNNIKNGKKITYNNLLLYGKPGTGKTLFARILADRTDMDIVSTTAASLLQSGVQGIKYFNDIMDMAKNSRYGLIVFIDEGDALFANRESLDPSSDHYKVLNHILSLTGDGSDKFMLVVATNNAYVMDEAMGRRFQDRVYMPLPGLETRFELLQLYANQQLFNAKENGQAFAQRAAALLDDEYMQVIAEKTEGLSHAEIKDIVEAMRKKALATRDAMITAQHIMDAVNQGIEKHKALEADKMQREMHANVVGAAV